MHRQQAKDNGLLDMAELDILDEEDSVEIPIEGGTRIRADYVGSHFANYDSFLVLSHFKGHAMAGFGGAIKNISIGFGSPMGKVWIHSGGTRTSGSIFDEQDTFLETMGDAAKGVNDTMGENIVCVSVLNRLSVDCDCDGSPAEPDMHDIGILLTALYQIHVPGDFVSGLFGRNSGFGVLMAATIGVPVYMCGGGTIPLLIQWLADGMSMGSASAFMITGPATKITNLGAVKIVLGWKRFILYILFCMAFAWCTGMLVDVLL